VGAAQRPEFGDLYGQSIRDGRHVCVGLDVVPSKIPDLVNGSDDQSRVEAFCEAIVGATADIVGAYKPNLSFFEAMGSAGIESLRTVVRLINDTAPGVPVILDAKRADIDSSNSGYVESLFEYLGGDATTLHPYLGHEALKPFLSLRSKGFFILCRTSNPGASEIQDLEVAGEPLFMRVASMVNDDWNSNGNCGLVTGATYPEELARIRQRAPSLPLLIPGVGAQGGDVERTVRAAFDGTRLNALVNSSRAIIYASSSPSFASDARDAAIALTKQIDDTVKVCGRAVE
jgi:orotidine-5'-phosphate decarboxylase